MYQVVMFFHVLAAVSIVLLVLAQQGKGATVGAAFGSGASQTMFGSRGSGSFLLKLTLGFVVLFFLTSITLNRIAVNAVKAEQQPVLPVPVQTNTNAPSITPNSIPGTKSG